ncbi:hypothetical protein EDC04DRAFT_2597783 [Pisolithus marmoratus]|nr:hypothetical protein EDC04DRAFT_2597783 [Pisolithus marmoratus]
MAPTSAEQSKFTEAETDTDTEAEPKPQPIEIKPIMVTGHTWCDIRDVQYHVWTKEDGAKRIDLDDSKRVVDFIVYPHIKMEEAEQVIRKGLNAVKKGISKLLSTSTSKSAVCRLQAADLRVHFDWRVIQVRVMASSWATALLHYEDWYFNMFHGTKHAHLDDNKYQPMESLVHVILALVCMWSIFGETQAPGGRGHPTHAHCLLQYYCDSDPGEFIDIEQELGDIDDENHERQENVQPQATAIHTASTDPLATRNSCQGQSRRNIVHDINHFFQEEVWEGESLSLCNICNYSYSAKSSTTMCCGHLDSQHLLVYLDKIEENNWPAQSKYLTAAFERGYTFNMLQEALNCAGTEISHLPPPGVDDRVPVGKLPKGDLSVDLPKFSIQGLHEFLVDFIVSNDQLRVELKRAIGVISFTADIWSTDKLDSYLAMMAHWIGHELGGAQPHSGQLAMKATLITFHCLPTSHMGKEIAKAILHLINHAEIPVEKAVDLWVRVPQNVNLVLEKLETMHWEALQDPKLALHAPAMAHHTMTSECIPLLGGALPAYETFLEQWRRISMSSVNPQVSPLLREGLAHGEQYHKLMHANKAYVFVMLFKHSNSNIMQSHTPLYMFLVGGA